LFFRTQVRKQFLTAPPPSQQSLQHRADIAQLASGLREQLSLLNLARAPDDQSWNVEGETASEDDLAGTEVRV